MRVMRREINWEPLRRQAYERTKTALRPFQTYDAIRLVLSALGDHHSGLIEPALAAVLADLTAADSPSPQGKILSGRIGYILVPPIVAASQETIDGSATRLVQTVQDIGARHPCGWIVDLQTNTGGNMWPMLAGLGPILGEGTLGGFLDVDNVVVPWSYQDGVAMEGRHPRARTKGPAYRFIPESSPIAVLISRATASSGEAVAVAFQGRPQTRFFGEHTRGATTSNAQFPLRDGAILNLSVSWFVDRANRPYRTGVTPDETIGGGTVMPQSAAENWLLAQTPCHQ